MKKSPFLFVFIIAIISLVACETETPKFEKYCWSCGGGITKQAVFCEHCGVSLKENSIETTSNDGTTETSQTSTDKSTEAEATSPSTCNHNWRNATCTTPKTCEKCNLTEGEANGHWWHEATCTDGKICTVCLAEDPEGKPLGHTDPNDVGYCIRCGTLLKDTISASESYLTIQQPTTITINVTCRPTDYPDGISLNADYDSSILEIEWGEWDGWTIPLTIIPIQDGTATIRISISENPTEYKDIGVTITGFDTGSFLDDEEYEKYVMAACAMNYFFETSKFPNTVCFKNVYFTNDNGAGNRLLLVEGYGENNFGGKSYAYIAAMIFSEPTSYPVGNYTNYELWNGMYVRTVAHNDNPYGYSMGIFTEKLDEDLLSQVYYELFDEYSVQFE